MSDRFHFPTPGSFPPFPELSRPGLSAEVPVRPETLADGRAVLVAGTPERWSSFEPKAADSGAWCCHLLLEGRGGAERIPEGGEWSATRLADTLQRELGVADVVKAASLEDLAQVLEAGAVPLVLVNAGALEGDPSAFGNGDANLVMAATASVRDASSGELAGFTFRGAGGERFVGAEQAVTSWLLAGSLMIVAWPPTRA